MSDSPQLTLNSVSRWYALVVIAGREESIRKKILDNLERSSTQIPNLSIICPDEEVILEGRAGERERKRRMSLPGYILVYCRRLSESNINAITRVPGVMEFLGGNERPTPLPPTEVDKLLGHQSESGTTSEQKLFDVGMEVTITEGPLAGFTGTTSSLNESAGTANVDVEIFGRATKTQAPLRQLRRE